MGYLAPSFTAGLAGPSDPADPEALSQSYANPEVGAAAGRVRDARAQGRPMRFTGRFIDSLHDQDNWEVDYSPSYLAVAGGFMSGLFHGANEASERLVNNVTLGYTDEVGLTKTHKYPKSEVSPVEKPFAYAGEAAGLTAAVLAGYGPTLAENLLGTGRGVSLLTAALERKQDAERMATLERMTGGYEPTEDEYYSIRKDALSKSGRGKSRVNSVILQTIRDSFVSSIPYAGRAIGVADDAASASMDQEKMGMVRELIGADPGFKVPGTVLGGASSLLEHIGDTPGMRQFGSVLGGAVQNTESEYLGTEDEWGQFVDTLADRYPRLERTAARWDANKQ